MPLSALLPYAGPIISGLEFIYNKISGDTNAYETAKAQKEANQQNREWALEDWHRQNAYNHPAQNMERLRQAGLNPNLVYGKGADMAAAVIKGTEAKPTPNLMAPADTKGLSNGIMMNQQLQLNDAQIAVQNAQALSIAQDARRKKIDNDLFEDANVPGQQMGNIYAYDKQLKSIEIDLKATEAEIQKELKEKGNQVNKAVEELANLKLQGEQLKAQNLLVGAQKDKTMAEIDNVKQNLQILKTQNYSDLLTLSMKKLNISMSDPIAVRIGLALATTTNLNKILSDVNSLTNFISEKVLSNKK